jgi:hypothetical protein
MQHRERLRRARAQHGAADCKRDRRDLADCKNRKQHRVRRQRQRAEQREARDGRHHDAQRLARSEGQRDAAMARVQ